MVYRNYYYFVATLPSLNYGERPHKTPLEFEEECYTLLHPKDTRLLPFCRFDPKLAVETIESTGSDFIDTFLQRERILILNLASLRAAKLRRQGPAEVPQDIPRTVAVAKAAFEMDDPLQATLHIDRARWGALDTMVGMDDIFGLNNILVHFLKLQLLDRKQRFDPEIGAEIYKERYDTILDEYNSRDKEDN